MKFKIIIIILCLNLSAFASYYKKPILNEDLSSIQDAWVFLQASQNYFEENYRWTKYEIKRIEFFHGATAAIEVVIYDKFYRIESQFDWVGCEIGTVNLLKMMHIFVERTAIDRALSKLDFSQWKH